MSQVEFIFAGFTRVTRTQTIEEVEPRRLWEAGMKTGDCALISPVVTKWIKSG
jgi:hypothetical protein